MAAAKEYKPEIPKETTPLRSPDANSIIVELKNAGTYPIIMTDVHGINKKIPINEKVKLKLKVREAERLKRLSLQGAPLLVINASDVENAGEGRPKIQRVRLSADDVAAAEHVRLAEANPKGRPNPRKVIRPEITTPEQLVAAMSDGDPLAYNHFASVALRILPPGTFKGIRPSKALIQAELDKAIKRRRR